MGMYIVFIFYWNDQTYFWRNVVKWFKHGDQWNNDFVQHVALGPHVWEVTEIGVSEMKRILETHWLTCLAYWHPHELLMPTFGKMSDPWHQLRSHVVEVCTGGIAMRGLNKDYEWLNTTQLAFPMANGGDGHQPPTGPSDITAAEGKTGDSPWSPLLWILNISNPFQSRIHLNCHIPYQPHRLVAWHALGLAQGWWSSNHLRLVYPYQPLTTIGLTNLPPIEVGGSTSSNHP